MKKLFGYFLQGLIIVAPLAITAYVLYFSFETIDGWLVKNIEKWFNLNVPGMGILAVFVLLTLLGFIGQTTLVKPVIKLAGKLLHKIPFLNFMYTSLSDLFSAFVGKEKKFSTPVKVYFNKENGLWKMGFLTKESMDEIGEPGLSAVYFPHSYNFSGELYLVPKENIARVEISPAEAMKFIVSGGATKIEIN